MTHLLTPQLAELAETLHDLRRRLRQTARLEVARAVGEALRELSLVVICGPVRVPSRPRTAYAAWDDPWDESASDSWYPSRHFPEDGESSRGKRGERTTLPPALLAGLGAARWGFVRTRQWAPSLAIGILVAVAASIGGPTVQVLLETWSAATDLLHDSDPEQRPGPLA